MKYQKDPMAVLVLTQAMRRAHQLKGAEEMLFCDTTSGCDGASLNITFLMRPTAVGAAPLGVCFTDTMTEEAYAAAFGLLKEEMGEEAFFGKKYPLVAMTDDSKPERDGFHRVWEETTLLLCLFHVPQAVWRWLYDGKHGIDNGDRQSLMHDFLLVMRARSPAEAAELYQRCSQNPLAAKYENWLAYLANYWDRKTLWCMAFRYA